MHYKLSYWNQNSRAKFQGKCSGKNIQNLLPGINQIAQPTAELRDHTLNLTKIHVLEYWNTHEFTAYLQEFQRKGHIAGLSENMATFFIATAFFVFINASFYAHQAP